MITIEQIKAARALLGWTQDDLVEKSGISKPAINNLERRSVVPRGETLRAIQDAIEEAGVEFTEGPGVRLRVNKLKVEILEGSEAIFRLFNDFLETLRHADNKEVLGCGIDDKQFFDAGGERIAKIFLRNRDAGLIHKCMILEGDTYLIEPLEVYRWVPADIFSQVPYFVWGHKYCIILWGPPMKIVVIENKEIADSYRAFFNQKNSRH